MIINDIFYVVKLLNTNRADKIKAVDYKIHHNRTNTRVFGTSSIYIKETKCTIHYINSYIGMKGHKNNFGETILSKIVYQ